MFSGVPLGCVRDVHRSSAVGRFVERHDDTLAPRLAQRLQRLVDDDAREPRRDGRVAAELADMAIRGYISLLQRILGAAVVLEDRARGPVEAPVVASHQRGERGRVAALHLLHEPRVIKAVERYVERFHCDRSFGIADWMPLTLPAFPIVERRVDLGLQPCAIRAQPPTRARWTRSESIA